MGNSETTSLDRKLLKRIEKRTMKLYLLSKVTHVWIQNSGAKLYLIQIEVIFAGKIIFRLYSLHQNIKNLQIWKLIKLLVEIFWTRIPDVARWCFCFNSYCILFSSYMKISVLWDEKTASNGQLILKRLFGILNSSKIRTKKLDLITMIPKVDLFLFLFWKNLKTPKRHFEINWPLQIQTHLF